MHTREVHHLVCGQPVLDKLSMQRTRRRVIEGSRVPAPLWNMGSLWHVDCYLAYAGVLLRIQFLQRT